MVNFYKTKYRYDAFNLDYSSSLDFFLTEPLLVVFWQYGSILKTPPDSFPDLDPLFQKDPDKNHLNTQDG